MSQPNRAIETGRATNATRGATASTLTTSGSWIDLLAASVPTPVPTWEEWAAGGRTWRSSPFLPPACVLPVWATPRRLKRPPKQLGPRSRLRRRSIHRRLLWANPRLTRRGVPGL
jgi:hypothetical protein